MPIAIDPLQVFQGGPEVTAGTAVAATRKFSLNSLQWTDAGTEVYRPTIVNGILLDHTGGEMVMQRGGAFVASGPAIYNELHRWASMCVGTLVTTGAGPYTHTFTRSATSTATLKTWTLERRLSDGSTNIDNEWTYALAQSLKLSAALGAPMMMEVNGVSRRKLGSTLTPALAQVTMQIPPALQTKVYIDPSWATLGSTLISGQVLSWDCTIRSGVQMVNTIEGRTDLDPGTHAINGHNVGIDINVRMMVKVDSGQFATEDTAAQAQTLRAVRLEVTGTSSHSITIDALVKHVKGDLAAVDVQDGFMVFDMPLISSTDNTNAYRMVVVNAETTL